MNILIRNCVKKKMFNQRKLLPKLSQSLKYNFIDNSSYAFSVLRALDGKNYRGRGAYMYY